MLQEKMYYLSRLKNGPVSQRTLCDGIKRRFDTSPAAVKNALLNEGLIELHEVKREGVTQKLNHYYKLTGKKFVPNEQVKNVVLPTEKWEDGTVKSVGNAFDWRNSAKGMFDNREVARMTQKYHQNKPITIYSRA